jgi:DNA ligase D-like protein (predicted 3'-phosphoesterase)
VGHPRFVVQHHIATADHYDLRLEIGGVLVSWAVPKGPSLDPADRRLAMRTEDHGMEHETFEGRLGDRRNGGVVQVWDRGTYRNTSHVGARQVDAATGLDRGHLSFWLDGQKLQGGFSLIRTRDFGGRETWLLKKKADEEARPGHRPTTTELESVLSGKTIEQIDAEGDA